ncbi:MAG: IS200/IS605 family transposase [Nitrososphaerota archaeon]|jgi:putative transposase|nr:IS200/IS605 family transposase [Nitrososphaerota archaeon]MDG7041175.1 IS200/IS605 family transposase [Nitrososphaerota archaeon]MDG7047012.1 IS200/IS605 family transposase [Nitrososphaerota archaeon]MDG7047509.1 IS200/IS605 family transposase [Nitrososphaerota archaeon]
MVSQRWKRSNKSVYNVGYHLIWCPKYRRQVLVGEIEKRLKELLDIKAMEIGVNIEKIEVMPDHVHLFVKTDPTMSPHFVIQQFKGYTSRVLRQEFPHLKSKLPTLWTRSYYVESVGHISEAVVKKYIEEQKKV